MTKLVTAVAVMQLVERGVVSLDDDVCEIIPEFKDIEVFINGNGTHNSTAHNLPI
jgi:CubicO group peptidase (beta-lactamase class C family)